MLLPLRMMIMTSAVAVVGVVKIVGSTGMTWSSIAVLDVSLRGCIEAVLERKWYIVAGTGGADAGVAADVDGAGGVVGVAGVAGGVAGAMVGEVDVVVAR
jgi:hypothetical protein